MVFRWKVQPHGLRKTLPLACKHVDLIVPCDLKGADKRRVRRARKRSVGGIEIYPYITLAVPLFPLRIKNASTFKPVYIKQSILKSKEMVSLATTPKLK